MEDEEYEEVREANDFHIRKSVPTSLHNGLFTVVHHAFMHQH